MGDLMAGCRDCSRELGQLSIRLVPNWPVVGFVLTLHALAIWGLSQVQQPVRRLDFGSPMLVRFIEAPPAPKPVTPPPVPKPVPKVQRPPKPESEPKPKPEPKPRVKHPPKPAKKPIITQTRPKPVPMAVPKPPPRPSPPPKPTPPRVSVPRPAPRPPRSAPATDTAKQAPVTPPNILAAYQNNPPPVYPIRARILGEQGEVLLRVHIISNGRVDQIKVQRSSGYNSLDDAALEAVRDWRFAPARRGKQPVATWVLVPIQFKLN